MASPCESCARSSLSTCPEEQMQPSRDWFAPTRCEPPPAEVLRTSQRQRQTGAASPRPEGSGLGVALPRGGGGVMGGGGGGSVRGSQGGFTPGGFFDSNRRIFRRIFLADFFFCILRPKKNPPQNPPQNPPLRGEFLFQKSPGLEAPEIHRPPPPQGEQIQLLCVRVWDRHLSGWEFPGKDSRFNWTSEPQNPYRKNRCGMAMHGVPCSMSY